MSAQRGIGKRYGITGLLLAGGLLLGAAAALIVTSAIGVAAGSVVSNYISEKTLQYVAGIGFIGIGLMGLPLCQRLLNAGFPLTVWNRNLDKCRPLCALGARQAASPARLAAETDVIFLCVSDSVAVQQVVSGQEGLLSALGSDQVVIDLSSIDPDVTRDLARQVQALGAHWVDAPVSGGVVGAEAGTLVIMAGGDGAIIDRVRPVLAPLSQRVTHMGPSGAGQVTKICNQLIVAANAVLIAEAVALAEKAGVPKDLVYRLDSGTARHVDLDALSR